MQQRRKNDRARSKKSSPAPAPALDEAILELPVPPSPPVFMLDDDDLAVAAASRRPRIPPAGTGDDLDQEMHLPPPVTQAVPTIGYITPQASDLSRSPSPAPPELPLPPSHTVTPVLISKATIFESLSRAVRSIYPSTVPVPVPSKKRRPVSFSSFVGDSLGRGRGAAAGLISNTLSPLLTPLNVAGTRIHDIPDATIEEDDRDPGAQSPDPLEDIVFTSWMQSNRTKQISLLFLGYAQGFQIWDTTSLDRVQELVNLKGTASTWGSVFGASLLNSHSSSSGELSVAMLVGDKGSSDTELVVYSLIGNNILTRKFIPGALRVESSSQVLVVSSVKPPLLHLISTTTFQDIRELRSVSSSPVFSLSGRFIAFACPPPQEQERHLYSNPGVISRSPPLNPIGGAIKVGQGIYSGIKALGGMAVATTVSTKHSPDSEHLQRQASSGQWFSKSAPTTSHLSSISRSPPSHQSETPNSPQLRPVSDSISYEGSWVTVMDIETGNEIHRFQASNHKPVTQLHWSSCGTQLYSANLEGQTVSVYNIRPNVFSSSTSAFATAFVAPQRSKRVEPGIPWHIYDLHRGHTAATVLSIVTSNEGLWTLVSTQRGTLHVFATNPYGGPPDIASHLRGEVRNAEWIQPLSTPLVPIVRIKPHSPPLSNQGDPGPLAARILTKEESKCLPKNLSVENGFVQSETEGFQDILVFRPELGEIELYRIKSSAVEPQPSRARAVASQVRHKMGVSESSPELKPVAGQISGLTRMMDNSTEGLSLQGQERSLAVWNVRRGKDWNEVERHLKPSEYEPSGVKPNRNWHSEAEISTCSRSPHVMPPSIYLSHQFSFFSFGEEWDALLRSDRFVLPLSPIPVRQEVEVKASADGAGFIHGGTTSTAREQRGGASSRGFSGVTNKPQFDEPMANALSDSMLHLQSSPPTYPMFPNGYPSVGTGRVVDTAPIRRSAQLVGEGLGKLGREIATVVRSPKIRPHSSTVAELDQELEDEEFLDHEQTDGESRSHSGVSGSISTPDEDEEGMASSKWKEWGEEEMAALEEVERFDEIYPAGMLEEDDGAVMRTPTKQGGKRR